jgi:hypothetical protein
MVTMASSELTGQIRVCRKYKLQNGQSHPKKNELAPHLKRQWCISELNSLFLWRMEDLLHVCQQPYGPLRPVICYDECPCVLIGEKIVPLPISLGKPKREDYHCRRNSV